MKIINLEILEKRLNDLEIEVKIMSDALFELIYELNPELVNEVKDELIENKRRKENENLFTKTQ